jgi:SepF-like predicted cell division protein (DUF552 family)
LLIFLEFYVQIINKLFTNKDAQQNNIKQQFLTQVKTLNKFEEKWLLVKVIQINCFRKEVLGNER